MKVNIEMTTIYVFENALLGDDGDQWKAALIDQHTADTDEACLAWAAEKYDVNDYTSSFTAP